MKKPIRAIIVDDQEMSRIFLESMISENFREVEIVGIADSVESAVTIINRETPNLFFLDVELDQGNAFDILNQVDYSKSELIFTTGYEQYALGAIKVSAADYLQKPIELEELRAAIEKARKNLELKNLEDKIDTKIPVNTSAGIINLSVEQIIRCESDHYYTKIFMKTGERYVITKTLKEFEGMLTKYGFVRVHQSHLISLNSLAKFDRVKSQVELVDGYIVPVSRRKKEELLKHL